MKIFFCSSVRFSSSDEGILKFRVSIKTCFKRVRNLNYEKEKNMPWTSTEIKSFQNTKYGHVYEAVLQTAVSKNT